MDIVERVARAIQDANLNVAKERDPGFHEMSFKDKPNYRDENWHLYSAPATAALEAAGVDELVEALEKARWYVDVYDNAGWHNPEQQGVLDKIDAAIARYRGDA